MFTLTDLEQEACILSLFGFRLGGGGVFAVGIGCAWLLARAGFPVKVWWTD